MSRRASDDPFRYFQGSQMISTSRRTFFFINLNFNKQHITIKLVGHVVNYAHAILSFPISIIVSLEASQSQFIGNSPE